jgi:hypothetical protein
VPTNFTGTKIITDYYNSSVYSNPNLLLLIRIQQKIRTQPKLNADFLCKPLKKAALFGLPFRTVLQH